MVRFGKEGYISFKRIRINKGLELINAYTGWTMEEQDQESADNDNKKSLSENMPIQFSSWKHRNPNS
jgi:hypothetical protein